ncbi:C39 family peptidase [Methylocaldum sp.]|uniref:C39 family peptidase n=1 Tax=Methylocaldum sp. TaxID=1969727 RepID=UPI002D2BB81E|nr:C39 family peptidase [Methylocaldum sp.]HYE35066.1 C39 family peptidase [Methylocaldum sp.]
MAKLWRLLGGVLILHAFTSNVGLAENGAAPGVKRHTLKELRDRYVVKQNLDYSCGAAALATLLRYYYGEDVTEKEILTRLNTLLANLSEAQWAHKKRIGFSLLDLKKVAMEKGYRAAGFELTIDQLRQLVAPVLVYVHPFEYHHFAILRGIAGDKVYLADPSRGNLRMTMSRFKDEYGGVVFVLGKAGEEQLVSYPLALNRALDYPEVQLPDSAERADVRAAATTNLAIRTLPR